MTARQVAVAVAVPPQREHRKRLARDRAHTTRGAAAPLENLCLDQRSDGERGTAATGSGRIRVTDHELGAFETFGVIHF